MNEAEVDYVVALIGGQKAQMLPYLKGSSKAEKRVKFTFDSCLYLIKIKRRHDPQVT